MVVDKFGHDTGEVVAQNGQYQLELQPSSDNTDPRDPSLYLVGGDPRLLVEHVTPLPTAVDAPIQVVWPRDAMSANVTGVPLLPGRARPCRAAGIRPSACLRRSTGAPPESWASGETHGDAGRADVSSLGLQRRRHLGGRPGQEHRLLAGRQRRGHQRDALDVFDEPGLAAFWQQRPTASCAP